MEEDDIIFTMSSLQFVATLTTLMSRPASVQEVRTTIQKHDKALTEGVASDTLSSRRAVSECARSRQAIRGLFSDRQFGGT
jgi:hypothetical protein